MKPYAETRSHANSRWLLPVIVGTSIALMICVVAALALVGVGLRQALATARATGPSQQAKPAAVVIAEATAPVELVNTTSAIDPPPVLELAPAAADEPVVKWEYQVTVADETIMNKAGANGWELVAVTTRPVGPGTQTTAYFKRPLREAAAPAPGGTPADPPATPVRRTRMTTTTSGSSSQEQWRTSTA
jgi:hypothetical protein